MEPAPSLGSLRLPYCTSGRLLSSSPGQWHGASGQPLGQTRVRQKGTQSIPPPRPSSQTHRPEVVLSLVLDFVPQAASLCTFWVCWDNSTGLSADCHPLKGHGEWVCTFVGMLGISVQHQNMAAFLLRPAREWEDMAEGGHLQWLHLGACWPHPWLTSPLWSHLVGLEISSSAWAHCGAPASPCGSLRLSSCPGSWDPNSSWGG